MTDKPLSRTMNIYTPPGSKIRFSLAGNGYPDASQRAREVLVINEVYTVRNIQVGGWTSYVTLEEVPGSFNTVMFSNVDVE